MRVGGFISRHGRLLLVEQRRAAEASGPTYWLLPGGGVRHGETLVRALRREVREETGLEVAPGRPIALVESISPDASYPKHVLHIILTADLGEDVALDAVTPRDPAVLSLRFFAPDELSRLALRPPLAAHLARYLNELPSSVEYLGELW